MSLHLVSSRIIHSRPGVRQTETSLGVQRSEDSDHQVAQNGNDDDNYSPTIEQEQWHPVGSWETGIRRSDLRGNL